MDKSDVFNISAITKVLFATSKYPDIEEDQLFCPMAMAVVGDNVEIFGQVIQMCEAPHGLTVK